MSGSNPHTRHAQPAEDDPMHDDDPDDKDSADALARAPFADADNLTAAVLGQLSGFASNPMIALDHDPAQLARVAILRAVAALRELTRGGEE